jgi:hypothetical protein
LCSADRWRPNCAAETGGRPNCVVQTGVILIVQCTVEKWNPNFAGQTGVGLIVQFREVEAYL